MLLFDPTDPAEVHYRLAALLHKQGDTADSDGQNRQKARRHVLIALAEAPRYRAALRLLREMQPREAGAVEPLPAAPAATTPAAAPHDSPPLASPEPDPLPAPSAEGPPE